MNTSRKKRVVIEHQDTKENVFRNATGTSRKCLHDRFELEQPKLKNGGGDNKRSSRYRFSTSVLGSPFHPRRALKSGTDKLTKTINNVRTTIDSISQRLRSSTRRRTLFSNDGSPATPLTPDARTRRLLGRTPTKLYSPFGIESPPHRGRAGAPKQDASSLSRSGVEASTRKKVPRCRHRAAPGDVREACGNGRCVMCTAHYIHMSLRI